MGQPLLSFNWLRRVYFDHIVSGTMTPGRMSDSGSEVRIWTCMSGPLYWHLLLLERSAHTCKQWH